MNVVQAVGNVSKYIYKTDIEFFLSIAMQYWLCGL